MNADLTAEFLGVSKDFAATKLPPGLFQEDQGGDRYKIGSWRRRRGMRHTDQAKLSAAVVTLIGFEMPGNDFALVAVEGANVHGFTNVAQQA